MDKLLQKITVRSPEQFASLSNREKTKLLDEFMSGEGKKALMIGFPYSHSGRLINRRIYSRIGHMQVADSLMHPAPKPLTLNHVENDVDKIVGRFTNARYVDTIGEAAVFLQAKGYNPGLAKELSDALTVLDFEKAANIFHKTKVLKDRKWPGIGYVDVGVRVTSQNAIEKFLDQRYQNFSAEQDTDMMVCSICLENWKDSGAPCEHPPGTMHDGKLAFIMAGNMIAGGSSVVIHGADDLSILTSMSFTDAAEDPIELYSRLSDVFMVDSVQQLVNETKEFLMNELITKLLDGQLTEEELVSLYDSAFALEGVDATAKLSLEDRKTIPASALIGGFPIHDSAHAQVAKALLGILQFEEGEGLNDERQKVVDAINTKILALSDELDEYVADAVTDAKQLVDSAELDVLKAEIKALKDQLAEKETLSNEKVELESKLADAVSGSGALTLKVSRLEERTRAVTAQYRELMRDHVELAKKFESQAKKLDTFADKTAAFVGLLTDTKDVDSKNFENIYQLLDSVDFASVESKLNSGLIRDNVDLVADPIVGDTDLGTFKDTEDIKPLDSSELPSYEKNVLKKFLDRVNVEGLDDAKRWFQFGPQAYCTEGFNPLSYMEK
jgi:hypothetical protein